MRVPICCNNKMELKTAVENAGNGCGELGYRLFFQCKKCKSVKSIKVEERE